MFSKNPLYLNDIEKIILTDLNWTSLKEKKIFITGATGMIGTMLVDVFLALNKEKNLNLTVFAMGRNKEKAKSRFSSYVLNPNFHFICGDINMGIDCSEKIDLMFHCASNTHPLAYSTEPVQTVLTNIIGTKNVLDYAVENHSERVVFLSTVEVYGENRGDIELFSEDYCGYIDCNTLRAGYPEGKRAGEALCQAYRKQYGIDVVIPRISRVYGPTMLSSDSKALSQFIKKAVLKENIVLKSEGTQYYSYCYVTDVITAICTILLKGKSGEAYNVADVQSNICLKDLANILSKEAGSEVIFELPDQIEAQGYSKATKALLDSKKLHSLGWSALYSIEEGLTRTVKILQKEGEHGKSHN